MNSTISGVVNSSSAMQLKSKDFSLTDQILIVNFMMLLLSFAVHSRVCMLVFPVRDVAVQIGQGVIVFPLSPYSVGFSVGTVGFSDSDAF